jgi:hypothetical protein
MIKSQGNFKAQSSMVLPVAQLSWNLKLESLLEFGIWNLSLSIL